MPVSACFSVQCPHPASAVSRTRRSRVGDARKPAAFQHEAMKKNIPKELYSASKIDGAGSLTQFSRITLPMLSPTTFFVIIVTLINCFLVFEQTYTITKGGPANSTLTFALHIYNNAFLYFKMGYASALSFIFFLLLLSINLFQTTFQKKWVFYQ